MTTERVDFFFSYRSPYSYLAAPRAFALADRFTVDVIYRGVLPMAMRGEAVPRAKRLHTVRDVAREAKRLGMPFGHIHDPIGDGAWRCLLVGEYALDVGRERAFVLECSRGIWSEAIDVARDPGLRIVCERAGLDWPECRAALGDSVLRARVEANTTALGGLGHWGVPVLRFGDELFWGQDRIEDVERGLVTAGLERA
jgi:2-hydroxychromene-2-carboxylate isomerase